MQITLSKKSFRYKILRFPLYKTRDMEKADKSRFEYRVDENDKKLYVLALLGILHHLIGLVVVVEG